MTVTPYVIDTSALVKLVVPEEHSSTVRGVAALHTASRIQLIAPDFLMVECANVLWKNIRRGRLSTEEAMAGMNTLRNLDVRLEGQGTLIDDALRFGVNTGITVYDALFCVVAERNRASLITDDRVMVNRIAGTEVRTITLDAWTPPP